MNLQCPKCGDPKCEPVFDEVDIGVGTQVHTYGAQCAVCGFIARCDVCGRWEFEEHQPFCKDLKVDALDFDDIPF